MKVIDAISPRYRELMVQEGKNNPGARSVNLEELNLKLINQAANEVNVPYLSDPRFYLGALIAIALLAAMTIIFGAYFLWHDKNGADAIIAIGATAMGGLVGIFSGQQSTNPQQPSTKP